MQTPRRSSRTFKPKKFQDYVTYDVSTERAQVKSTNVHEALSSCHRRGWKSAMKEKFAALIQNQTWKLCDPPHGIEITMDIQGQEGTG